MKKIQLDEIQGIELDILVKLIEYLNTNNIKYFTSGGTTLGSIRHNGFIPWDDDIDIYVPRKDYDKLLEISEGVLIDDYISIKKPGDKNYIYSFAKACNENTIIDEKSNSKAKYSIGIFVDIFPLDKYYDNKFLNRLLIIKSNWYKSILETASNQINLSNKGSIKYILKQIIRAIQKPLTLYWTVERTAKHIDNLGRKMESKNTNHLGNVVMNNIKKIDYYAADYFKEAVIGEFEGYKINNPVGYDKYLTEMYGDYMTPPPKDKQIMHGFDAWYK